ncbi:MAG: response regulator [Verrucomicrobiales bacterium]|nr:response regulator [Verrucomicrobiales bacterium]
MSSPIHHSIPPVLPPANCFTVFVIDDMLPNRILLGKFLKNAGYAVFEATNGIEALDLLRERAIQPDLIITDVEMPVMDGITLVEQIRSLDSSIATVPIITASGNSDEQMYREAIQAGTDIFLSKPFDLRMLQKNIAGLLKTRRRTTHQRSRESSPATQSRVEVENGLRVEK